MAKQSTSTKVNNLQVVDLGLMEYAQAWALQKEYIGKRLRGEISDTLLFVEHPAVITVGRGTKVEPNTSLPIFEIERGGDVTLHAPGQLVGYPIISLETRKRDLHVYLRKLEELIMQSIADFGLVGERKPGLTGVWVKDKKIASIGVACRKWITYHGFALNVNNDLELFQKIRPCGLEPSVMTSISQGLQKNILLKDVKLSVERRFCEIFSAY